MEKFIYILILFSGIAYFTLLSLVLALVLLFVL